MRKQLKKGLIRFFWISVTLMVSQFTMGQASTAAIDKIIAKIDNYIILKSELEIAYLDFLASGEVAKSLTKCEVLQQLVVNKMLAAQANIDSIFVDEEEVNANLDRRIAVMQQQFGGIEAIEKAYNKPINQIREEVFDNIKEQLVIQKMQAEITSPLKITPLEVRRFFKAIPQDSLPYFSTEVSIAQIVLHVNAGENQKNKFYNQLLGIRERILAGEPFATLAKQYSEDPGSASLGGELPFFGRGELDPKYEAAVFALKKGEISMPVETQFGFHIIELLEKRGNIFKSRHIIIKPKPDNHDFKLTEKKLSRIRQDILNDSISFEAAAKEYSEDQITASSGGFFQNESGALQVFTDQLDPKVFFTIDTMEIGHITQPLPFQQADESHAFRILLYKNRKPPHLANLEDDYQRIADAALGQKKNKEISKWFDRAQNNVFIEIDPDYTYCNISN